MIQQIINKLSQYSNIAILGFGREGKTTYEFIRKYNKDIKLTIIDKAVLCYSFQETVIIRNNLFKKDNCP